MLDADHLTEMKVNYFQDGIAAYTYMVHAYALRYCTPMTALQLRDLNKQWDALDLMQDIGINANSISQLGKHLEGHEQQETCCLSQDSL